jgi:hypothetical protein
VLSRRHRFLAAPSMRLPGLWIQWESPARSLDVTPNRMIEPLNASEGTLIQRRALRIHFAIRLVSAAGHGGGVTALVFTLTA